MVSFSILARNARRNDADSARVRGLHYWIGLRLGGDLAQQPRKRILLPTAHDDIFFHCRDVACKECPFLLLLPDKCRDFVLLTKHLGTELYQIVDFVVVNADEDHAIVAK